MGEVLRRHWHPVAGVDELARTPVKPLRLLGEDLVLYQDLGGRYGLLERHCAHRGADLSQGFVEGAGLRCNYHGWQYDAQGACLHQPYEEQADPSARLKARVRLKAYPVRALAGMLWAYLGPAPAPELPDWEAFHWRNGFVQAVFSDVPCNWLQCQENSVDPVHFEWMHANWSRRMRGHEGGYAPRHLKLAFEEFEHGLVYKRITEDSDETHPLWTIGRVCLWPHGFFLGDHFEWRVPVDDENTLNVTWSFIRVPREREPFVQDAIPTWASPVRDASGRLIASHVINQDICAWVGQGRIADRTGETLGASDAGVAMLRRRLFADIEAVQAGRDPKGVLRDPERSRRIVLPSDSREFFLEGLPLAAYRRHPKWARLLTHFTFHAGQPEWVREAHEQAIGVAIEPLEMLDL
nr:aromatic ring-hydroxylating dioxygenase subunit alpha [Ramlibacter aurantiacus]